MSGKPTLKKIAWALSVCFLFLHSGCGVLNKGTFAKDETGAYIRHFHSCGPSAIQDALAEYRAKAGIKAKRLETEEEISKEIQENGNLRRFTLAIFDEEAMAITWPSEIKKYFTKRGLDLIKTPFSSLQISDTAIVLINKDFSYHWVTYPTYSKNYIKNFYGGSTKIIDAYIIKKRAAN